MTCGARQRPKRIVHSNDFFGPLPFFWEEFYTILFAGCFVSNINWIMQLRVSWVVDLRLSINSFESSAVWILAGAENVRTQNTSYDWDKTNCDPMGDCSSLIWEYSESNAALAVEGAIKAKAQTGWQHWLDQYSRQRDHLKIETLQLSLL